MWDVDVLYSNWLVTIAMSRNPAVKLWSAGDKLASLEADCG
jgi:hypothetical protein